MLMATVGGLIITPYLFFVVQSLGEKLGGKREAEPTPTPADEAVTT